jgi:hypothetical protein
MFNNYKRPNNDQLKKDNAELSVLIRNHINALEPRVPISAPWPSCSVDKKTQQLSIHFDLLYHIDEIKKILKNCGIPDEHIKLSACPSPQSFYVSVPASYRDAIANGVQPSKKTLKN